ncbi:MULTISPECIES: hypothetical protein [unclassified Streptomyces]|uniref:hypothetical protein n=1 Tax=unclassified Streptomyces TaxID=2593676 RepID=UPI0013E01226|nr:MULTISPECIES: hypothetical protein [unclassified Streptomyces]
MTERWRPPLPGRHRTHSPTRRPGISVTDTTCSSGANEVRGFDTAATSDNLAVSHVT